MFSGCTGLTEAPELPATTLAASCYNYMFSGCTGLTEAPELPATTLAASCYNYMFSGCANIRLYSQEHDYTSGTFRVPSSGTILEEPNSWNGNMFAGCGGDAPANLLANTVYYTQQVGIGVLYDGRTLCTLGRSGTATLLTDRRYLEGDISIKYSALQRVAPGTPTAVKGAVGGGGIYITPSVTNPAGEINGGTVTGTPVHVTAQELASGEYWIYSNGEFDVVGYETAKVDVPLSALGHLLTSQTLGDFPDAELISSVTGQCVGVLYITATIGGDTMAAYTPIIAYPNNNTVVLTGGISDGNTSSTFIFYCTGGNGLGCQEFYLVQGGTLTDLTSYASAILSDISLILYF